MLARSPPELLLAAAHVGGVARWARAKCLLAYDYFGTLKIASRLPPTLMVWSKVPTKTRFLPVTAARRQRVPLVIRSPFRAFFPLIRISPAICDVLGKGTHERVHPDAK